MRILLGNRVGVAAATVKCATDRFSRRNDTLMTTELLECIERQTGPHPDASVIWMHGLGADGNDFVPIVNEMRLPPSLAIRFVFPHAPVRPVTLNNGFRMRAWYDIAAGDITNRADIEGVRQSQVQIDALIAREKTRGIAARRIVLAGFSQGGVIAIHAGVRYPERLAGIVALSTYVVQPEKLAAEASAANKDIPIFMAHGTFDPMIRLEWGEASRQALVAAGYSVEWHTYPMPHSVVLEEIDAIKAFFVKVLAPAK
jgi:phospholipase/carboxylesterase